MKKLLSIAISATVILCLFQPVSVFADTTGTTSPEDNTYYIATESDEGEGNLTFASGVTEEMCESSYWDQYSVVGSDRVLATASDIQAYNDAAYEGETDIWGIEKKKETFTAQKTIASIPTTEYYCNGTLIDNEAYFGNIIDQYNETSYPVGSTQETGFGLCVKRTSVKAWPITDVLGYSETDPDDEMQSSCLIVNEPFVVLQKCTVDGVDYYCGQTDNSSGWVLASDIAICDSKDQWLNAWDFDLEGDDFLVITQDKLTLEESVSNPYSSNVELDMGTALRLIPESEWNEQIKELAERGTWDNYVVYLPVRTEDGGYEAKPALIAQHYSTSVGYLPLTESNVLDLAFSNLGDRYGWGGSLGALDCSGYIRNLYRCFGYTLPRNTVKQLNVQGYTTSISDMSDEEKIEYIKTLPEGSLLYMTGHAMVYTGTKDGVPYVISDTGSLADSVGELGTQNMNSVILTPLTVRRSNGSTWLSNLTSVVTFTSLRHTEHVFSDWEVTKEPTCTAKGEKISTCELCGYTKHSKIAALGHTWGKGVTLVKASIYSKGVKKYTCTTCGAVKTKILPKLKVSVKPTQIKSLSKKGNGFKVVWKKISGKSIDGYQIQYSTNKNFKSAKTVKISNPGITQKTIKGLSAKKYYVRIRTYRKVDGKTYYSSWSKKQGI